MLGPPGSAIDDPRAVLFCCNLNAARSPMAEALLKHYLGKRIYVDSVGVRAQPIDPFVVSVMDELGIDLSKHKPKSFDELEDTSYDLIVSLTPEAQHKAVEMTRTMACEVEYWPTLDPTAIEGSREQRLDAYRQVRDGLAQRIRRRFKIGGAPQV
jgi:protein-tyrosine-phosphatase